jgi:DNA polymerase-3 subunit gamma/tau
MSVNADGSWRDGLSLLEQVLAYTESTITVEDVHTVLGTVTQDFLFRITDILAEGDQAAAFEAAAEAVNSGKEMQQLLRSLAGHMRNLLFALVTKNADVLTTSAESAARMQEQAAKFSKTALLSAVSVFTEAEKEARYSEAHRLLLELALLKIMEGPEEEPVRPQVKPVAAAKPVPERTYRQPEPARPAAEAPQKAPAAPEKISEKPEKTAPEKADHGAHGKQTLPEFDKIYKKWNLVLQHVKSMNITAHALLTDATPTELRGGSLVLKFKGEGQKNLLMNESGKAPKKQALLTALERVFGVANAGIICEVGEPERAPVEKPEKAAPVDAPQEDTQGQETLASVLDMFGGEIVS